MKKIVLKNTDLSNPETAKHVADLAVIAKAANRQFSVKQVGDDLEVFIGHS